MSILTTIYGASDDLVEITSVCFGEELNVYERARCFSATAPRSSSSTTALAGLPARRSRAGHGVRAMRPSRGR